MDIRRTQNHDSQSLDARRKAARGLAEHTEAMADSKAAGRAARARMEAAGDLAESGRKAHDDRVDLSGTARLLASGGLESDADRAALVQELKSAYEAGTLNSAERIQRAAARLLGGE